MSREKVSKDSLRRMAELLKSGATMLSTVCPSCKTPLYKLKSGEVICPNCDKRYYVVPEGAREEEVLVGAVLDRVERMAASKISSIVESYNVNPTREVARELILWLEVLDRVEKVKKSLKP